MAKRKKRAKVKVQEVQKEEKPQKEVPDCFNQKEDYCDETFCEFYSTCQFITNF